MSDIKTLDFGGTPRDIKDALAREQIAALQQKLSGDSIYLHKLLAKYNGRNLGDTYTPAAFQAKLINGDFTGLDLGDFFDITLTTGEKMRYAISGFNPYLNFGDTDILTANHAIMTPVDCMAATAKMNETDTNTGGYAGSLMPAYLEGVLATFPAEWRAVMRPIRRLENNKGTWAWATRTLFLLSETEVHGHPVWTDGHDGGTRPLPLYQLSSRYRVKGLGYGSSAQGQRAHWWLASPYEANTTDFCHVTSYGNSRGWGASNSYGVVPGFCV